MYQNNLIKYNFNMEEIKLFDSFAGIGALHKSLQKLGIPTRLVGMSEIDIDAIISYSAIYDLDKSNNLPTEDEMRKYLMNRNIGFDFKKGKSKIPRLKKDKLIKCYIGSKMTNNYGDISLINPNELPDFDLFNFSFPCTNISVAGKQEGMKKEDGSITSSGLYIYGINIIKEKKPKYIMIENVKNLISKKFIGDFNKIINELEEIGYTCYYPTKEDKKGNKKPICLNAKNYGIPQNRERIFVICVRKDVDNSNFKFWEGKDFGIRLKDILEDNVDKKYYLNKAMNPVITNNYIQYDNSGKGYKSQAARLYYIDSLMGSIPFSNGGDKTQIQEILKCTDNIIQVGELDIKANNQIKRVLSPKGICHTIDTMQGGQRQPKIICNDYYLSEEKTNSIINAFREKEKKLIKNNKNETKFIINDTTHINKKMNGNRLKKIDEDMYTLTTHDRHGILQIDALDIKNDKQPKQIIDTNKLSKDGKTICEFRNDEGIRYFKDNICGTIRTIDSGGDKRIIEKNKFKKMKNPYDIANEYIQNNGFNEPMALDEQNKCVRKDFTVGTLTTDGSSPKKNNRVIINRHATLTANGDETETYPLEYSIRKLTPLECWRLMGFDDEDFYKAQSQGVSDSQLYKQAGNSIVVNCLYYIFKELFKNYIIN